MIAPVSRILLRYVAGILIAKGWLDAGFGQQFATDTDVLALVQMGVGFAAAAASEGWYWLARKFGWTR